MRFRKPTVPEVFAVGALTFGGCRTNQHKDPNLQGYSSDVGYHNLIALAGIHSGDLKVRKFVKKGARMYFVSGSFCLGDNRNSMKQVLRGADRNRDRHVSREEFKRYQMKVLNRSD
tara:strand:- start:285 stop:632 length:348 start_codon:yes stop_codon:yes gene_type:complete